MRLSNVAIVTMLVVLWVILPVFLLRRAAAPGDLIRIVSYSEYAQLWFCSGTTLLLFSAGAIGYLAVATMRRRSRILLLALVGLVLFSCWAIVPLSTLPLGMFQQPAVAIQASSDAAVTWLLVALSGTLIICLLLGRRIRRGREKAQRDRLLIRLLRDQLGEAIAVFERGSWHWMNVPAQTHLFHQGKPDPAIERLVARAVETGAIAGQSLTVNESVRYTVQATPQPGGAVAVIARPIGSDHDQSNFYERFIRRIVHDMRNPLAAIIAHASNLQASNMLPAPSDSPEAWKASANTIEHEAQRLTRLVDSMLFDARLAYLPLALEPLDLADILEDVFYQHDERASRENKSLEIEKPSLSTPFNGDRDLLVRAFSNLVDNSLKYSKEGAVVLLSLEMMPTNYVMKVADTGDGIPPEYLPDRIFEPLVRARQRDGGSGLGLAIVKKIIEMHGGSIAAESKLGRGTIVRIALPRAERQDTP